MRRATDTGCSVWRVMMAISWRTPLSYISKSSLVSDPTSSPSLFFTVVVTCTSRTSTRMVGLSCANRTAALRMRALAGHRNIAVPLSFHPDFAVNEMLFLPNRHDLLEPVNAFQRGFKGGTTVRRGDDN